ncbi:MAG: site-2 protease family protein, partial [Bacteroidota bacterium]
YAMILFVWGERKIPIQNVSNGIEITDSIMYDLKFKDGDKILAIDNEPIVYYDDILTKLITGENVKIERNGKEQTIDLPVDLIGKLVKKKKKGIFLFLPRVPVIVGEVPDTTNASKAGLKKFDRIVAVDSVPVIFYDEMKQAFNSRKGDSINLVVQRNNRMDTLHTMITKDGTVGFFRFIDTDVWDSLGLIKVEKKSYGFFESFPAGVKLAVKKLNDYIEQFKKILSPKTEAYKGLGGFGSMASAFPSVWDWQSFWSLTAFFCVALAFMNILPIPALDGGHVLFTLLEMITGRKPSQKFLEYAQVAGMILLLSLVLYVNGNDWFGWGKGK